MRILAGLLLVTIVLSFPVLAEETAEEKNPVIIGAEMIDFTLLDHNGVEVALSSLRGKNVMLVFPRGKVGEGWCHICHYQYADLADVEVSGKIREKYDLEILFVLPYDAEAVTEWISVFPSQMSDIDGYKNPTGEKAQHEGWLNWAKTARRIFPKKFEFSEGEVPLPFPILVDAGGALSKKLDLFRTEWDGYKGEQNVSTVYILDKEGVVQFKYFGQTTFDRPDTDYLLRFIEKMM